jgi:thiaminase/transcriptional activator TenA
MTPCLRLYAYLGQQLAAQTTPDSPYREWVMTYSSPQFEALARRVEGLLDRYGGDHDRLAVLYHQAMELELRFFDAAARRSARAEHAFRQASALQGLSFRPDRRPSRS